MPQAFTLNAPRDGVPLERGILKKRFFFNELEGSCSGLNAPAQILLIKSRKPPRLLNGFRGQAPKTNRPLGRSRLFAGASVCFGSPVSVIFAGAKSDFDALDVHLSHSKNHYQSSPAEGAFARLNVF
ncbi:hypothetical protein H735_19130 [Vibrio owensii CAIM 1854 = LMG 25443]|uniref:Uncharacterized protein n=1 Tax=Vibrio owensii CAIM 1854 = LMG 25443 TaxID=1229493 RepID=A0A0C1Z392_9VIBR|nr:hypothetical protein H735_19130 [Vibrio owensii CAIM 1854 = LMG 25443]